MTQGGPVCRTQHTFKRKLSNSKPRYKGGGDAPALVGHGYRNVDALPNGGHPYGE